MNMILRKKKARILGVVHGNQVPRKKKARIAV
jgi:hypothetical protein